LTRRFWKILGYILLGILLFLAIVWGALQTSKVQNYIADKILAELSAQYEAEWSIDDIHIDFMDEITISGLLFKDQLGDTLLSADLLQVDIGLVSLLGKEIMLDQIILENAYTHLYYQNDTANYAFLLSSEPSQKQAKDKKNDPNSKAWSIGLGEIILKGTRANVELKQQSLDVKLKKLAVQTNVSDFNNKKLEFNSIALSQAEVLYTDPGSQKASTPFEFPNLGWSIASEEISIEKSQLTYARKNNPVNIDKISTTIQDVTWDNTSAKLDLQELSFYLNDNLQIDRITADVTLAGDTLSLDDLSINTTNDVLSIEEAQYRINAESGKGQHIALEVDYPTLQRLKPYLPEKLNLAEGKPLSADISSISYLNQAISVKQILLKYGNIVTLNGDLRYIPNASKSAYLKSNLNNLTVDLPEVVQLWDGLTIPDSLQNYEQLTLKGSVDGTLANLNVENTELKIDNALTVQASGTIQNLDEIEQLSYNLNVEKIQTNIQKLPIPDNENIALDSLGMINFTGTLKGSLNAIDVDGQLQSDLGKLSADLSLSALQDIDNLKYRGDLNLSQFDAGTLLNNDELGELNIQLDVNGSGIDLSSIDSNIKGKVQDFNYKGYTYEDINLDAKVSERTIDGNISIDDKNAQINYSGEIKLDSLSTALNFTADIDTLNLSELGFLSEWVSVSGKIDSELRLPLRSGEQGHVDIMDFRLSNKEETFTEDSILMTAHKVQDSTFASLEADFMDVEMKGEFGIRDIPVAIGELVDHYINMDTTFRHQEPSSESLDINADIRTLKPVSMLFPNIRLQSGPAQIASQFDFTNKEVQGTITIDSFFYSSFFSERMLLSIQSQNQKIQADLQGTNNSISSSQIPILKLNNKIEQGMIASTFIAKDDDDLPRLRFSLDTEFGNEYISIALQDSLILNQKDWLANRGNEIRIFEDYAVIDRLTLTDNNEKLTIESVDENGKDLAVRFDNFSIGQFTTLITSKPSRLNGHINGAIDIRDMYEDLYFVVNLNVNDVVYDSTKVGVLRIKASEDQKSGLLTTRVDLRGKNNDFIGEGTYDPESKQVDFDLDIAFFQMMLLDPFLSKFMTNSNGLVTGEVRLDGTVDQPQIKGSLTLENATTTVVVNNTQYGLDKHTVTFDNQSIDIGTIDLFDAQNNVATLSGKIYHTYLQDMSLDMRLTTDKFTFLNTSSTDNPVFYGKIVLDADVEIAGPIDLLEVDVAATTLENSEITISPFSIERFLLEEDFITYGKPSDFEDLSNEYLLKLARKYPFIVNIKLDAREEAKMNFVVDPVTGDRIEGRGNGNLNIILNPDGEQEIYGNYTISDGSYSFSYGEFVSKNFKVNPGGQVKFNGNPLNAALDIEAIYNVYTTTYELIKNEIFANQNEISAAKQRTNVQVILSLEGTLDQPAIELDIQVPDLESENLVSTIDRKLSDLRNNPNELNNQVFGLLIFNSFILSDNANGGFASIGNSIALSSISNLISSQLNNLAEKVVSGVDVDINVNSYDSQYVNDGAGGNVTEVGITVSKQLFNDRLSISAGGNYDLADQSGQQSYSSLIGDFVLEYKLTESGRYRVRVFSKTDYDRLLYQNTNTNGVSLFFNHAFDSKLDD